MFHPYSLREDPRLSKEVKFLEMWRWKGPQRSVSLETGKLQLLPTPPPPPPCPEGAREEIFPVLQSTWSPPTMQLYQSHKSCHRGHIKNEYCHVPMTPCWWTPMFEFHKIFTCHKILGFPTAPPPTISKCKNHSELVGHENQAVGRFGCWV